MMPLACSNYLRDEDGGAFCPNGASPEDDETWDELCERCNGSADCAVDREIDRREERELW